MRLLPPFHLFRLLRVLALLICTVVSVVVGAPVAAGTAAPADPAQHHVLRYHRGHAGTRAHSLNWAGYIRTGQGFHQVSANWTVPTLSSAHDGWSSTWVGIDGATASDQYLIQTGTEADVVSGRRSYRAWWEVITPDDVAPEVLFSRLVIHPGDSISASVSRRPSGRWTMRVRDNTTGVSASHTATFSGPGRTAEWIQEDTAVDDAISTAPDWGVVAFRRCHLNAVNAHLAAKEAVDLVDREGTREIATGAPTSTGDAFTVTWLAPGVSTRLT